MRAHHPLVPGAAWRQRALSRAGRAAGRSEAREDPDHRWGRLHRLDHRAISSWAPAGTWPSSTTSPSGKREKCPAAARFYPCDIRSAAAAEAVERSGPTCICHHAAQIDVRRSMADPRFDADVNIGGLLNLMQAAVRAGSVQAGALRLLRRRHLRRARTSSPRRRPTRSGPVSHYGVAKAASELYLGVFAASYGIPYAALRYANVYGPRQNPHGEAGRGGHLLRAAARREALHHLRRRRPDPRLRLRGRRGPRQPAGGRAAPSTGAVNVGTGVETDVNRALRRAGPGGRLRRRRRSTPRRSPGEQRRSCIDPPALAGQRARLAARGGARPTAWRGRWSTSAPSAGLSRPAPPRAPVWVRHAPRHLDAIGFRPGTFAIPEGGPCPTPRGPEWTGRRHEVTDEDAPRPARRRAAGHRLRPEEAGPRRGPRRHAGRRGPAHRRPGRRRHRRAPAGRPAGGPQLSVAAAPAGGPSPLAVTSYLLATAINGGVFWALAPIAWLTEVVPPTSCTDTPAPGAPAPRRPSSTTGCWW